MEKQADLPLPQSENKKTRLEPRLWLKEFAVYRAFKPEKKIRQVSLRAGLNIIWAKDSEHGASGHAAGKSTFARMLRYLLGDASYGSDEFKTSLRIKLPDACIAGEVHLDGIPWLIVRPLGRSGHHRSSKNATWDQLFDEATNYQDFQEFTNALADCFVTPLASANLPGTGRKIEWGYLLQWLTRDQDARYAHMLQWRTGSDGGEGRSLGNAEKTNLVRMVLGLLTKSEQRSQKAHAELLVEQKELEGEVPKLSFSRDRILGGLKKSFSELADRNVDYAMALSIRKKQLQERIDHLTAEFDKANRHDGVGDVLPSQLAEQTARKEQFKNDLDEKSTSLKRLKLNLQHQQGGLSQEEFRKQSAALGDMPGKCSNSLEMAYKFGCPIAPPLLRDELQDARLQQAKGVASDLAQRIELMEKERQACAKQHQDATSEESKTSERIKSLRDAHAEMRQRIFKELTETRTLFESTSQALIDQEEAQTKRARLKKLGAEIDGSAKDLAEVRKRSSSQLSRLSAEYSSVATHILQQQIFGSVQFNSDEIIPSLNYEGDMSSAALVTLRLLIFDLACLVGSAGPFGLHPGFLLHDSPREADLSAGIYRRIFTLVAGEKEMTSVQYIIATTEPPPTYLQSEPWLACELSSAEPEQRFLKTIV